MPNHLFPSASSLLTLLILLATAAHDADAAPPNRMPQGGGVIYPAWTGEYWANAEFSGAPSYTRSDIRIRFDWEDWRPVLGIRAESVRNFSRENFSARWRARLVARFDEEYTFRLLSDERARFKLRPVGAASWQTLIDAWSPHVRRVDEASIHLTPGTIYEIEIEYANLTGDAVCSLAWSSPSTPEEVVDYAAANSIHFTIPESVANIFSFSGKPEESTPRPVRSAERQGTRTDENGWPVTDFREGLIQLHSHYTGRGLLVFRGLAEVNLSSAHLEVDGQTYATLPKGIGYNPARNETRAHVLWPSTESGLTTTVLTMKDTQRSPTSPVGSGVTELEVLLPRHANGSEPHQPGEIIHQEARDAYLPVFTFRVQGTGLNDIVRWEERTLPSYSKIIGQVWRSDIAYEKLILAANETGRDLHLNFSGSCDEEFMRKLALLMRYGSDGVEPYTKPTPDPVWPPLSPNLRLYLEHGNEMGWSAIQPRAWQQDFQRIRDEKGPVWQALNFDGALKPGDTLNGLLRYHAYRTARMSEAMRSVWGADAMGEVIRVCLFGQYERYFQSGMVQYLHDYFGNPTLVPETRKPSEILWASGPAVYYGTTNNFAVGAVSYLANSSFEETDVAPGGAVLRPSVPGWAFSGNAGVADCRVPRQVAVTEIKNTKPPTNLDTPAVVGFAFTVGPRDLYVYEVGRVTQRGEQGRATTTIVSLDGTALATSRHLPATLRAEDVGKASFSHLEYSGWATTDSSRVGVWRLVAGQSYAIITQASAGELASDAELTPGPGLTIDGAVIARNASLNHRGLSGAALERISGPGRGFPHVTFRYAWALEPAPDMAVLPSDPLLDPTWRNGGKGKSFIPATHRDGTKSAFLAGGGRIAQDFSIEEQGEYALVFTANGSLNKPGSRTGDLPFTIRIDGTELWRDTVGDGRKPNGGVFQWGTRYLTLDAGRHVLEIESNGGDPRDTVYFYAMHLANMRDYYGGPGAPNFLGAGAATGQTEGRFALIAELCTAMAQVWGLVPYAYEGGTQAGGDWNGGKLFYTEQFKWTHPMSKVADHQWARFWHRHGGFNAFYYYPGFPYAEMHRAESFMPWAAAIERAQGWELEPAAAAPAPVTFTPAQPHFQGQPGSAWEGWFHPWMDAKQLRPVTARLSTAGVWKGFVFRAPKAGHYTITARTTRGGTASLVVNDRQAEVRSASGQPLQVSTWLTQGIHAVVLRNLEGDFALEDVAIAPAPEAK